jgi:predicted transcriptional regulator
VRALSKEDFRKMSDSELDAWRETEVNKELAGDQTEEHKKQLRTMQNPVRREIMMLLKDKALTTKDIAKKLNIDEKTTKFHLQLLQDVFYVTVEGNKADLTPLGVAYTRHVLYPTKDHNHSK